MPFVDYLPPVWVSYLRRTRRSVPVYKPAMLLAALDLIENGTARPDWIPLDLCAARFRELVAEAAPALAAPPEMPIYHLATQAGPRVVALWTLLREGQVCAPFYEPSSMPALLRVADAAAFIEPLRADLATPDGRQRVRWAVYDLLESDDEAASTALLRVHDRELPRVEEEVERLAEAEHTLFTLDDWS